MHVIRKLSSKEVVYINHFSPGKRIAGKLIFPEFNDEIMEVGWTEKTYIPIHFDIDENGRIIEISKERKINEGILKLSPSQKLVNGKIVFKSMDELLAEGIIELTTLKNNKIEAFSRQSFELRQQLLPDYKLHNAALGIYDDATRKSYQATVCAFRDEFYRLKAAVGKPLH